MIEAENLSPPNDHDSLYSSPALCTSDINKKDYDQLFEKDPCHDCQFEHPGAREELARHDIFTYYYAYSSEMVRCYNYIPFMYVLSIERGGVVVRYRVVIGIEVYEVIALHLKNPCPKDTNQQDEKGFFGRVTRIHLKGGSPYVKKIMKVRYPISSTGDNQNSKEMKMGYILKEYCLVKRAGIYSYGPSVIKDECQFDIVCYSDYVEFAMEECVPLKKYIESNNNIDMDVLKKRFIHCVKHMHHKNLVHLDIKPYNFLYSPSKDLYLLTDFGLARAVPRGPGFLNIHETRAGTFNYSSEQFKNFLQSKHKQDNLDLHGQDCYALLETFKRLDKFLNARRKFSFREVPLRAAQVLDEGSERAIVERLLRELSGVYTGRICKPSPLPKGYEWLVEYFPEYSGFRKNECDLPKDPVLLQRSIELNFKLSDYHYHAQMTSEAEKSLRKVEYEIYKSKEDHQNAQRRLKVFQQTNRSNKMLERIINRNQQSEETDSQAYENLKGWMELFDEQVTKHDAIEDVIRYYDLMERWWKKHKDDQPTDGYETMGKKIAEKKLYLDLLKGELSREMIEWRINNLWRVEISDSMDRSEEGALEDIRFETVETVDPNRLNSEQPFRAAREDMYGINNEYHYTYGFDRLDSQEMERIRLNQPPSARFASMEGASSLSKEEVYDRHQQCICRIAKILFSRREIKLAHYFANQLTDLKCEQETIHIKFAWFRSLKRYLAVRLLEKELNKFKSRTPVDKMLVAKTTTFLDNLNRKENKYVPPSSPEGYYIAPEYTLRQVAASYYNRRQYKYAQYAYESCAEITRLTNPKNELFFYALRARIGEILVTRGFSEEGFSLLNRCIETVRFAHGDHGTELSLCYYRMGMAYRSFWDRSNDPRSDMKRALKYFQEAMNAVANSDYRVSNEYMDALKQKACCHELLFGRYKNPKDRQESTKLYEEGLQIKMEPSPSSLNNQSNCSLRLGLARISQGNWYAAWKAFVYYLRTIRYFLKLPNLGHYQEKWREEIEAMIAEISNFKKPVPATLSDRLKEKKALKLLLRLFLNNLRRLNATSQPKPKECLQKLKNLLDDTA